MKILFLASEVFPYSKTGGLADVAGALPAALAELGHEVLVATPLYSQVKRDASFEPLPSLTLRFPFGPQTANLHLSTSARSEKHRVLFVGNDGYFARPGIYNGPDGDYPDNHRRFTFFTMAALSGAQAMGFIPDVVNFNDWQSGVGAVALKRGYASTPMGRAKSVFTIHNLAYQGTFPKGAMAELGLPWDLFTPGGLEFYDQVNFLKAGLTWADALTTVSPRYAEEIKTPQSGWGLDGLLRSRANDLHGILNGVDVHEWNPSIDPHLPERFTVKDLAGKAVCKRALLDRFELRTGANDEGAPLFGIVSRFASQKGFEILLPALPSLLREDAKLVVLGSGDANVEAGFRTLKEWFPGKVGLRVGYDNALAHQIEAGSDFFLMPSQYEPCGLNQMYSLIYGTIPIVRAVGGLDDSVVDVDVAPSAGTGIKFGPYAPEAVAEAMIRALALYRNPGQLGAMRVRGMTQDFSWRRSAQQYERLFQSLLPNPPKAQ